MPRLLQAAYSTKRQLEEATHSFLALYRMLLGSSQVLAANKGASRDSVLLDLGTTLSEDRQRQRMTPTTSLST